MAVGVLGPPSHSMRTAEAGAMSGHQNQPSVAGHNQGTIPVLSEA